MKRTAKREESFGPHAEMIHPVESAKGQDGNQDAGKVDEAGLASIVETWIEDMGIGCDKDAHLPLIRGLTEFIASQIKSLSGLDKLTRWSVFTNAQRQLKEQRRKNGKWVLFQDLFSTYGPPAG